MTDSGRTRDARVEAQPDGVRSVRRVRKRGAKPDRRARRGPVLTIGWREWIGLPDLGIEAIRAKIDTGARSSSLHARDIELFDRNGERWARFEVLLDHARERGRIPATAPVVDIRSIKNSFGHSEERVIIRTRLRIGRGLWPIEVSLADRVNMTFPALLGRTAIRKHAFVDPGRSYLCKWVDEKDLPPIKAD